MDGGAASAAKKNWACQSAAVVLAPDRLQQVEPGRQRVAGLVDRPPQVPGQRGWS